MWPKSQKNNPSFIVKHGQQKPPQNRGGFCCIFGFFLSQFLCLFPLVSPYFLLFPAILEPQNSPPNEVTSIYGCIYIYIYFFFYLLTVNQSLWANYHSNRKLYQVNSPEFEVGNGKNYLHPKKAA